jgi:serine/threonine protein kinase
LPILILLERFDEAFAANCIRMGAEDYLVEPFHMKHLLRRIGVLSRIVQDDRGRGSLLSRYRQKIPELISGRYEKVERLGMGSYGEIWKVRDIRQAGDIYYVAKVSQSKKLNSQFLREAAICEKIADHPGAVKIIEVTEHRGRTVLVQEHLEGRTLQYLMERPLTDKEKKDIIFQLVDIVAYAHLHKIVHRDIKPENVFVGFDGRVKLLDYGIAKVLTEKETTATMVGSRPYMAPEQILGESRLASDVWALGVVMYEIYTQHLPFYDENEKAVIEMILSWEPQPPMQLAPDVAPELEEIILTCLDKDPNKRYGDASALKAAICKKLPTFGMQPDANG